MSAEPSPSEKSHHFILNPNATFELDNPVSELEIWPVIRSYIQVIQQQVKPDSTNQPRVEVNDAIGLWAFAYEKIRNSVEYREDGMLLRAAIKRILKRRLSPLWNYESSASALIRELIWARYLKNDEIPETKVDEIEALLAKYSTLRQAVVGHKESEEWQDWILGIAACDIEHLLMDKTDSYALAEVMFQQLQQTLDITDLPAEDTEIQLYLAVHRALLKSDKTLLTYHLFLINVDSWTTANAEQALLVARQLKQIRQTIDQQLNHPQSQELTRFVKKKTPPFIILRDIVHRSPGQALNILSQTDQLQKQTQELCQIHYDNIGTRIRTAIVRSVIYIFITKVGLALLLEVPFDNYFYGYVHWPQLSFNIIFPPLFMAILGVSIVKPGDDNTQAIYQQLTSIIDNSNAIEKVTLTPKKSKARSIISDIFVLISLATFALVAWVLWQFQFTVLGIALFLFFFCVVVFFTYRIRQTAREMSVIRQKENPIEGLTTVITLPFLALGYRLSSEFGRINVLTFVLDVLLEAPFKFILDMAERWVTFVRTKREEVIDRHDY